MSTFKARGVVLREIHVGESDKIVILLLKGYGKMAVSARGARKPGSKFLAGTQLFTYSDFIIYDGKKFFSVAQIDMIENFYDLRTDYVRLCSGTYCLELCDKVILESLPCDETLLLLLKGLQTLAKGSMEPKLIVSIFEFKFLQNNGYAPEIEQCSVCGALLEGTYVFGSHGLVCRKCDERESRLVNVSYGAVYAIRHILSSDLRSLFQFQVSEKVMSELWAVAGMFVDYHVEGSFNSKKMLIGIE